MPRAKQPSCVLCDRRRQPRCRVPTAHELNLALIALHELTTRSLRVSLVPAPRPMHASHKIRVVDDTNPGWYRTLVHRRPSSHSIRRYVAVALQSVLAGCVRARGMDEEILDVLNEDAELGR